jgi:hypothetical protein
MIIQIEKRYTSDYICNCAFDFIIKINNILYIIVSDSRNTNILIIISDNESYVYKEIKR